MVLADNSEAAKIKISRLEEKIVEFDSILCQIQDAMPDDLKIHNAIVLVRDYIFRLEQLLHGVEIIDFCGGGVVGGTA